jgi:hypothetical protein
MKREYFFMPAGRSLIRRLSAVLLAGATGLATVTQASTNDNGVYLPAPDGTTFLLPHRAGHQTLGTVNCASSNCHGSVLPLDGSNVLQNEYTTWSRFDRHARAYQVLLSEQSRDMVRKLGYTEEAHEAGICLDCHSHNPPAALRGERFVQSEGVGCEGCHGPAAGWIASHAHPDAAHSDNVRQGLYPTSQPVAQARLCLSCHFGDETRFVTHAIMGAGHPRLSFEMRTFTALAPAHFRVDDDYLARKGRYDPIRIWAVGQAVAAQQQLETLVDPHRGRVGAYPELVLFDCHSCHHPMSEQRWQPRLGIGPGALRLNDSHLLMLRAIVRATLPAESAAFDASVRAMHLSVSMGIAPAGQDYLDLAREVAVLIGRLLPRIEQQSFFPATQRAILLALIDEAHESSFRDYAGAEQAYMAVNNLLNELLKNGALSSATSLEDGLRAVLATLRDDERFDAAAFSAELVALRGRIVRAEADGGSR